MQLLSGAFREAFPLEFPHVPGNDFAGTVSEVVPGVDGFRVGDEVFGQALPRALHAMAGTTRPSLSTGALAEYAVFEADTPFIAHRPPELDIEAATALPTVGLTARALMTTTGIRRGQKVLVIGATGGVGTTLLPLLANTAKVTATATASDADLVRKLGYEASDYAAGVDAVFNLIDVLGGSAWRWLGRSGWPGAGRSGVSAAGATF